MKSARDSKAIVNSSKEDVDRIKTEKMSLTVTLPETDLDDSFTDGYEDLNPTESTHDGLNVEVNGQRVMLMTDNLYQHESKSLHTNVPNAMKRTPDQHASPLETGDSFFDVPIGSDPVVIDTLTAKHATKTSNETDMDETCANITETRLQVDKSEAHGSDKDAWEFTYISKDDRSEQNENDETTVKNGKSTQSKKGYPNGGFHKENPVSPVSRIFDNVPEPLTLVEESKDEERSTGNGNDLSMKRKDVTLKDTGKPQIEQEQHQQSNDRKAEPVQSDMALSFEKQNRSDIDNMIPHDEVNPVQLDRSISKQEIHETEDIDTRQLDYSTHIGSPTNSRTRTDSFNADTEEHGYRNEKDKTIKSFSQIRENSIGSKNSRLDSKEPEKSEKSVSEFNVKTPNNSVDRYSDEISRDSAELGPVDITEDDAAGVENVKDKLISNSKRNSDELNLSGISHRRTESDSPIYNTSPGDLHSTLKTQRIRDPEKGKETFVVDKNKPVNDGTDIDTKLFNTKQASFKNVDAINDQMLSTENTFAPSDPLCRPSSTFLISTENIVDKIAKTSSRNKPDILVISPVQNENVNEDEQTFLSLTPQSKPTTISKDGQNSKYIENDTSFEKDSGQKRRDTSKDSPMLQSFQVLKIQSFDTHIMYNKPNKHTEYQDKMSASPELATKTTSTRAFELENNDIMFDSYFTGRLPTLEPSELQVTRERYNQAVQNRGEAFVENNCDVSGRDYVSMSPSTQGETSKAHIGDLEPTRKSPTGLSRTPTATRKIKDLISEMHDMSSNETNVNIEVQQTLKNTAVTITQLDPDDGSVENFKHSDKEAHRTKYIPTLKMKESEDNYGIQNSSLTLRELNEETTNLISKAYIEEAANKYDVLPHIQTIDKYTGELIIQHKTNDEKMIRANVVSPITTTKTRTSALDQKGYEADADDDDMEMYGSNNATFSVLSNNPDKGHTHSLQHDTTKEHLTSLPRTSSANDLKAMIDVAKSAYKDTDGTVTPHSQNVYHPSSLLMNDSVEGGDKEKSVASRTDRSLGDKSSDAWNTAVTPKNLSDDLTCSRCFQVDVDINNAGYCNQCKEYLCHRCVRRHKRMTDTKDHDIVKSFCSNEAKNNRFVRSIGFCTDCHKFLCMKCIMNHSGFREFRHHKVVQTPVVMKTSGDQRIKTLQDDKILTDDELSDESVNKHKKKKRRLLPDIYKNNPYKLNYNGVPNTLYPSPYKDLPMSYTSRPKWPLTSGPALPYLIQPMANRMSPYFPYGRMMLNPIKRRTSDKAVKKMTSLVKRYGEGASSITPRRVEYNAFMVRQVNDRMTSFLPRLNAADESFSSVGKETGKWKQRHRRHPNALKNAKFIGEYCLSIPFPSDEQQCDILAMSVLSNGKLIVVDKRNNNIKLYNGRFECRALLQFANRVVDICFSNLCPTDLYAATPKYIYEISANKGLEMQRKIKVEIKRIEGLVCWKYGLAVIFKKTSLTWEVRLLDYRGIVKSKLEILNPFSHVIDTSSLYHLTTTKDGKRVVLTDTKNSCVICVDVLTRSVVYETVLEEPSDPSFLASDLDHNVYVSNPTRVCQLTKSGVYQGTVVPKEVEGPMFGCIAFNRRNDRLYIQTGQDVISVYHLL